MTDQIIYNFTVTMNDHMDHYKEEDVVKSLWGNLAAFMTRRHGVNKGKISLEDDAIVIEWNYRNNYNEDEVDD